MLRGSPQCTAGAKPLIAVGARGSQLIAVAPKPPSPSRSSGRSQSLCSRLIAGLIYGSRLIAVAPSS